jgi:hypothetical protein
LVSSEAALSESGGTTITVKPAAPDLQQPAHFVPPSDPRRTEPSKAPSSNPAPENFPLQQPPHIAPPLNRTSLNASPNNIPAGKEKFSGPQLVTAAAQSRIEHDGPVNAAAYSQMHEQQEFAVAANFQPFPGEQEAVRAEGQFDADLAKNPCAALPTKPVHELGIGIAMPNGEFPQDNATECWTSINEQAGPFAGSRTWATSSFSWDATSLCHRPLYFEEINLERYGYGCACEALQPAASAAHFFGTIPALPYCMAAHCPGECIYTLGHYRPGSCAPRQCNWPPISPLAALAEGGVWTGMIFLIP